MRSVFVCLVHYPVRAKDGSTVTTSITNLDLHDIARSAHTYGVTRFYLVHPVHAQRALAERVREHWTLGSGARRIPDRRPAMELLRIVGSVSEALADVGGEPDLWATAATESPPLCEYAEARSRLMAAGPPIVLLFGTGFGLAAELLTRADVRLAPIRSPRSDGYNHLSVRAAVAVILDRLLGSGKHELGAL